jgi:hypothetical protein
MGGKEAVRRGFLRRDVDDFQGVGGKSPNRHKTDTRTAAGTRYGVLVCVFRTECGVAGYGGEAHVCLQCVLPFR